MCALDQRFERIEGAGVDVAGLKANYRRSCDRRQCIRPHAPLAVDRHAHDALAAQAQHAERLEQRRMRFLAGDDGNRRRAEQAVGFDVPAHARKHRVPGRGQRGEVGDRGAGDEAGGGFRRQFEQRHQPAQRALLQPRHTWSDAVEGRSSGPRRRPASSPPAPPAASRRSRSRRNAVRPSPWWRATPAHRAAPASAVHPRPGQAAAHPVAAAPRPRRRSALPGAGRSIPGNWRRARAASCSSARVAA